MDILNRPFGIPVAKQGFQHLKMPEVIWLIIDESFCDRDVQTSTRNKAAFLAFIMSLFDSISWKETLR